MDVYTVNLGGKYHDDVSGLVHTSSKSRRGVTDLDLIRQFYTNPKIIAAFKAYVKAVVTRYSSSEAIFAWQVRYLLSLFQVGLS